MATIKLIPTTCVNAAGTSYLTITNPENSCTDTNSTNYTTIVNRNQSTSNRYIYLRGFDFDSVPTNAIINSYDIKVKGYYTNGYSQAISLCNNTTALAATAQSFATSVATRTFNTNALSYDTISDYGDNFGIRINCRRNNRNTTATYYVYGAEINIDYTMPVYHTLTATAVTGVISPSGSEQVLEGSSQTYFISGVTSPTVTDNGNNVTSQLTQTSSVEIVKLTEDYTSSGFTVSNITNAYTDITSNTTATLSLAGRTTGELYLDFEDFDIPSNATIQEIDCKASIQFNGNGSGSGFTSSCQLYNGSTAKGSATTIASSGSNVSRTTFTLTPGTWTAAELNNARFYITATNNASSTIRYLYIYGIQMTVTYESDGIIYIYTLNNISTDHNIIVTGGTTVHVTGVTISPTTATLQVGETIQLNKTIAPNNATNQLVTWSVNNNNVTVNNGLVTAISAGTSIVTVTTNDGNYTANCTITVIPEVTYDYILTNTMIVGKKYLIANGNTGTVYMLSNESGGSRQLVGISATVSNNKITINATTKAKAEFECVRYTSGNDNTITVKSDNKYLYTDNSTGLRMNAPTTLDRFWHYQNNKFWQFKSTTDNGYSDTSTEYKYYLELNNSNNFTDNHVTDPSIEDSTLPTIYIFVEDDGTSNSVIYVKNSGSWQQYSKVYLKQNGTWVEQSPSNWSSIFNTTANYVKG